MDWLQFISSMVGYLAWPIVFLIVIFVIRKHLGKLLSRLIELHLPGGAKAVFAAELERGQDVIEKAKEKPKLEHKNPNMAFDEMPSELSRHSEIQNFRPQTIVLSKYDELIQVLKGARAAIGLSERMNLPSTIRALADKNLVSGEMVSLFDSLRAARNAALHSSENQITPIEAAEYARQADILVQSIGDGVKRIG